MRGDLCGRMQSMFFNVDANEWRCQLRIAFILLVVTCLVVKCIVHDML